MSDPLPPSDHHSAAEYGADAFRVCFVREADGEMAEFLSVQEIIGSDPIELRVGRFYARSGGTVYLPAGKLAWQCVRAGLSSPVDMRPTVHVRDHPLFREDLWPKLLRACAHQVSRRTAAASCIQSALAGARP